LPALGWAMAGIILAGTGAVALLLAGRLWFPWVIVAGFQVPFALGWSVLGFVQRASQAKDIPDHALLRCVGRGAYGEVWLARNAIGGYHAVKIIYRKKFASHEPFDREFRGIQSFAPISRSHRGLVHILHVGRNDLRGCFYYIMEPADDERSGTSIEPNEYCPKTLAQVLVRRKRLPVSECLRVGLELSSALDHLHQKQLIHRDVKPANIIFVNGQPKLADVGLVRPMSGDSSGVTQIGSSGYLAPEGPGTAAADVFALGKTLYEAATGCECGRFPELPSELDAAAETDALLRLHEILLTACEANPADRYASAGAMHADLAELQASLGQPARTA
jgi:serine/threonine protein kinase